MIVKGVSGLNPEAIHDLDDVKTWARDISFRVDSLVKDTNIEICDLKSKDEQIQDRVAKSVRLQMFTSIGFAIVLGIVVVLSGIIHIVDIVKGIPL